MTKNKFDFNYTYTIGYGIKNDLILKLSLKTMTESRKKAFLNFKKSKSLLEKIIKMIESDEYCISIMQQNLAVIGMLKSAHQLLMEGHLDSCFKKAMSGSNKKRQTEMIEEILKVTKIAGK